QWFLDGGGTQDNIARHFVAASTNATAVAEFGIDTANMFGFWDWVGGRYSLWSAIGLPIVLSIGFEHFTELLEGAYELDCHFRDTPLSDNVPVILALLGVWYVNFHDFSSHAVVPYAERLQWLPNYLQQADMESNGKQVTVDGRKVDYHTGPVIWGSPGTNGQHAYFQLLHQGTRVIPADFIVPATAADSPEPHHDLLLANCLAQGEALMLGRDRATTRAQLRDNGLAGERLDNLTTHRTFPGNRPSNTLLLNELSPKSLGQLIALYEHKIFVQGVIWGINSFDQWGVELGKQLADGILPELSEGATSSRNPSTTAIIEKIKEFRN
ncbi:MAG: glucose-6-phosphate isomerase, partial [Gammaproteobacteria bacterium]|nr:glucose-6-phosphate isomerase [Gammaproteobacteria bacterium]